MVKYVEGTRLQLEEDVNFQQRDWRIQRIAWVLFAVVLLAALLGVFGSGPLSSASVERGGVTIEYERFARVGRALELTISLDDAPSDSITIDVGARHLEVMRIENMVPQPSEEEALTDYRRFTLKCRPGSKAELTLHLMPTAMGSAEGEVRINEGEPLTFTTFVYP